MKGEALVGNTLMGLVGFFLVIAAIILGIEGAKALSRYRAAKGQPAAAKALEFVRNRVRMQDEHMEEIWKIFGDRVRSVIPLFETEVKGSKMLNRLAQHLFLP